MKQLLLDALEALEWGHSYLPPKAESQRMSEVVQEKLRAAIDAPEQEQEPYGWSSDASAYILRGEHAEMVAKAQAKAAGGTCTAWPVYRESQPVADLTDEQAEAAWNGLQERKRAEAAQFIKDQTGLTCGVCGTGALFQDGNGYNNFMRCNKCNHVPLYINGTDVHAILSAQKGKK